MKINLGLDVGTNSIGWALTEMEFSKKEGKILGMGSRIIPMSQDVLGKFDAGGSISQTAERTRYRGMRRLHQRFLLRRERLHRVLNIMDFLPLHYSEAIDFQKHFGQFKCNTEVKLNYRVNEQGKHEFIFLESFEEMSRDFKEKGTTIKIPLDWTIYYLRNKALSQRISKQELAWILLNFNQKRGYYQLRGDEAEEGEENNGKKEEFHSLRVKEVKDSGDKKKDGAVWYELVLENGWTYKRSSKDPLFGWEGKILDFIVTTSVDKTGEEVRDKEGEIKRSFRAVDSENDWIAIKKKTEQDIQGSGKTVGSYIYDTLLINPSQKIRGKLVKTIERKFYKEELIKILEEQKKHHPELQDPLLLLACAEELYPKNDGHQKSLSGKDLNHLLIEDIIFYQRPLKTKKSTISDCPYEQRFYIKDGKRVVQPVKCISRSHPLFQEFRLWQFLRNLRIYSREIGMGTNENPITGELLPDDKNWVELFDYLNQKKEINQKELLKYFGLSEKTHRWNYVEDKIYPCNETRWEIRKRLSGVNEIDPAVFLNRGVELELWHLVYSVKDKIEFRQALITFSNKHKLDVTSFLDQFLRFPPFKNEYGAYSEKAIKKLLPLMRQGSYWNAQEVASATKSRIDGILARLQAIDFDRSKVGDISDDDIPKAVLKSFLDSESKPYSGLYTYQACYAVYNRHSEVSELSYWKSPEDIELYLKKFKQHSLKNPIVEQVVTETLRVVKDIWEHYGQGAARFFDEIHLELGREMKNPKKKRESMSRQQLENETTNQRIRALLQELQDEPEFKYNVRSFSPGQQEILKIFEEGVYLNSPESFNSIKLEEIEKIRRSGSPTKTEISKYRLWLEQGYISPYTGRIIPLSKLFTTEYQIEHIIPQSRFFDNSLNNKIICESEINELKDNRTAYEFIKEEKGRIFELSGNRSVKLFDCDQYDRHCQSYFKKNRNKLKNLLSEEIPENFLNRQLTDSRYIASFIKGLLSNIVREQGEMAATSKNLITIPGAITSQLKKDWGLNDKWNEIISPRFKRLNEITGSEAYGYWDSSINAFRIQVPDELLKNFNRKRIDHRHHALDALIIACTTKDHVSYISSLNSQRNNHSLVSKLRRREEIQMLSKKNGAPITRLVAREFFKPWEGFTVEVKDQLEKTIVSFKRNTRIVTKTNNKIWQWVKKDGHFRKILVPQTKGDNRAIRKPLHKETVYGRVNIKREKGTVSFSKAIETWEMICDPVIRKRAKEMAKFYKSDVKLLKKYFKDNPIVIDGKKVEKVLVYEIVEATASRVALTEKFTRKQLDSITDSGIRAILNNHVGAYTSAAGKEDFPKAFGSEGLEELNRNISRLNGGKFHHPIYKVRIYEVGNKFSVGQEGSKKDKYVEAAKGTNLFFAIYWDIEKQKRLYDTLPLNLVIERIKQGLSPAPEVDDHGNRLLFSLSPNDLVYVPSPEEQAEPELVDFKNFSAEQTGRIYKMEKTSGKECYFIPHRISTLIKPYDSKTGIGEFGSQNKLQTDLNNQKIADICLKLRVNHISKVEKDFRYSKGNSETIIE